ncbi:hypothetical protein Esti_002547 [Eimeria stiedai]
MNFCLPNVDAYLLQQQAAQRDVAAAGAGAAAAGGPAEEGQGSETRQPQKGSDVSSPQPANSVKRLLQQLTAVAAAAQKIPGGDNYTIQRSSSSKAREAAESAAADTLSALVDLACECAAGGASLGPLSRAEAFHRRLAAAAAPRNSSSSSSSSSSGLLQQDGQDVYDSVSAAIQRLLDSLLDEVELCLQAHKANPARTVSAQVSPHKQQQQQKKQQQKQQQEERGRGVREALGSSATLLKGLSDRPQLQWAYLVDNYSSRFVPRFSSKLHAKYQLSCAFTTAQRRRAALEAIRRDAHEEALMAAADATPAQQQQLLLQHLQHLQQQQQQRGGVAEEGEDKEPLPHPYEGELNDLQWLLEGDRPQPGVYAGPSVTAAVTAAAAAAAAAAGMSAVTSAPAAAIVHDVLEDLFTLKDPPPVQPVEETPLILVETSQQLHEMLDELCSGRHEVVALDVEHHGYESYKGFVCLLQLSTCSSAGVSKDFLVDPFCLFAELPHLNRLTANPSILKILHGASSDVVWLQRDFSVYLVNVFDTAVAARALALPGGASLANLHKFYLNRRTDKTLQLADWRVRPLSEEMKKYARCDTHFLPHLRQCLQNQLLSRDAEVGTFNLQGVTPAELGPATSAGKAAVLLVMGRSRDVCLKTYVEGPFDAEAEASQILKRNGAALAPLSFAVLKGLLAWRDSVARRQDLSPHAVLPNPCVLLLAQRRPKDNVQLRHAIRPTPAAVRLHGPEIVKAINDALEAAAASALPPTATTSTVGKQQEQHTNDIKQQQQQQQQLREGEDVEGEDVEGDLLPSAAVLADAAAGQQQQLSATAEVVLSPPTVSKEETEKPACPSACCSPALGSNSSSSSNDSSSSSNDSSSSSNDSSSSSSKLQAAPLPVHFKGVLSGREEGPKPAVIVRVSSAVLSRCMQDMQLLAAAATADGAGPSSPEVTGASQTARQVARWVYRQLHRMETERLLHSRSSRRDAQQHQHQQQLEQARGDSCSSTVDFPLLPAHPPPPPPAPPEIPAATLDPQEVLQSAVSSMHATAAAAAATLEHPEQQKEEVLAVERKRPNEETQRTACGLLPIAQQKWKRRRKPR